AAQQPALLVDVLFPDLLGQQRRFAVGTEPAGHGHAVADLDLLGLRRSRGQRPRGSGGNDRGAKYVLKTGKSHGPSLPLASIFVAVYAGASSKPSGECPPGRRAGAAGRLCHQQTTAIPLADILAAP